MTGTWLTHPIRIMNVVPTLLCGGTENQFMTLTRALNGERYDVRFACLRRVGPFAEELDDRGVPLVEYPIATFRSLHALAAQSRFANYVKREGLHIVHAYNFYGNVFAVAPARLARVPVVIASIRDCGLYLTPMQKRVQRQVCRLADRVLVNAEAVRDWLVNDGYNPSRIVVIRNGVDLTRFTAAGDPAWLRAEFGLPANAPVVAVVSRLHRMKGLEQFLEAAERILLRMPDVRFLIVGEPSIYEPEYLDELKRLAERHRVNDRVVFTGRRSDVPRLLASVAVSVMPSLNEALSNVLLESMAAGAPTVATRVGGTPEAMRDEQTGLLVEPGDAAALADAIVRMLNDRTHAAAMGAAARQVIEDRFSIGRMAQATEHLYLELLARKAPSFKRATWSQQRHSPPV